MRSLTDDVDLAPIHLRAVAAVLDSAILIVLVLTVASFGVASGVSVGTAVPAMIAISAA